jgi:leader peptidase (prepilin peptidase) / N-methyltransferase
MDALVVIGAAVLGVLVSPYLLRLVVQVPAMATVGYVSDEDPSISPSTRELAVRVLTPVTFVMMALRWQATTVLVPFLFLAAVLVVVSLIDLEHFRIPDRIVFPALGISSVLIAVTTIIEGADPLVLRNAVIGSVLYFGLLLVPHLIYPRGMGFGDVKLALLMGLFLGWIAPGGIQVVSLVLWALMIGCGLGVLAGIGFALVRGRRAEFPFGPALALGCLLAIQFSDALVT